MGLLKWSYAQRRVLVFLSITFAFIIQSANAQDSLAKHIPDSDSSAIPVFDPNIHDWPHDNSDLDPDSRLIYGRLNNGLRYILAPIPDQKDQVSLRMQINAGAIDEKENEHGLAHLLEHLIARNAFGNSSKNLREELQKIGLTHGPDINAFTSYNETYYVLNLPEKNGKNIALGLDFFEAVASGFNSDQQTINKERQVVLEERAERDTPRNRVGSAQRSFIFPDKPRYSVPIIGTENSLSSIPRDSLIDFYNKYYVPENTIIVIVGDVNVQDVEKMMEQRFSGWSRGRNNLETESQYKSIESKAEKASFRYYHEPGLGRGMSAIKTKPKKLFGDSYKARREDFLERMSNSVFSNRLMLKTDKKQDLSSVSFFSMPFREYEKKVVGFSARDYPKSLDYFDYSRRQLIEYGFQDIELDRVITAEKNRLADLSSNTNNTDATVLLTQIIGSFNQGLVHRAPSQNLKDFESFASRYSIEDYRKNFEENWGEYNPDIWMHANFEDSNYEKKIAEQLKTSRLREIVPYQDEEFVSGLEAATKSIIDVSNTPSIVVFRDRIEPLQIDRIRFSNGVKLNLKQTDFVNSEIVVSINFQGGREGIIDKYPKAYNAIYTMHEADNHDISHADLGLRYADKKTQFTFSLVDKRLRLLANTNERSLSALFERIISFIQDVDYDSDRWGSQHRRITYGRIKRRTATALDKSSRVASFALTDSDLRFRNPQFAFFYPQMARDVEGAVDHRLKFGPMEIGIVGDFDTEEIIELVKNSFGSLPSRPNYFRESEGTENPPIFTTKDEVQVRHNLVETQVGMQFCREIKQLYSPQAKVKIDVIQRIIIDRFYKKLRAESGLIYSPRLKTRFRRDFESLRYICTGIEVHQKDEELAREKAAEIFEDLNKNGVKRDELARARRPLLTDLEMSWKTNIGWRQVVSNAQSDETYSMAKFDYEKALKKVSLRKINRLVKGRFSEDGLVVVRVSKSGQEAEKSIDAIIKRAKKGEVVYQRQIGNAFAYGDRVEKDFDKAVGWYEKAAELKDQKALEALVLLYMSKEHEKIDLRKAAGYLEKLSEFGNKDSGYRLAELYFKEGQLFSDKTNEDIYALYVESAERGSTKGQVELAKKLMAGGITQRDMTEAMKWVLVSKKMGNILQTFKHLERLKKELSEEEQAIAEKAAVDWIASFNQDN